ncbi:MAG: GNAT family N-acetyltransferase [Chloroflexi bacterium]|nr:GNAT family N-acetyltransferase [Chloroflexota bacterium]
MSDLTISFRNANIEDISTIIQLLADDPLGSEREKFEDPIPESYIEAFNAISNDPNNELFVATIGTEIVGALQLTFIPGLSYQGGWRALIEGVRVKRKYRNQGLGKRLFLWAIDYAKERGCHLVQLTSDKRRPGAIKFYESLGFQATHEGMKLYISD